MKIFAIVVVLIIAVIAGLVEIVRVTTPDQIALSGEQLIYVGKWQANQQWNLEINADGSGSYHENLDYKKGNMNMSSHSSMEGADVFINKTAVTFQMLYFKKNYKIDNPPHEENGVEKMTLNGNVYTKQGSGASANRLSI